MPSEILKSWTRIYHCQPYNILRNFHLAKQQSGIFHIRSELDILSPLSPQPFPIISLILIQKNQAKEDSKIDEQQRQRGPK